MEEQHIEKHEYQDRFTSFMFGGRGDYQQKEQHEEPIIKQPTINYEELMVNIDTLMESLQGFKPLFKKVYPFIEQFWKKK
ncbi:hypothetical protein [Neobacillus soli]|uniref:hypothetical protein n=1 Tax=Neobacillus soli TaxID=220688 RepID=UPI000824A970|nr:hypothetical protein [Neobacillus soli]